LDEPEFEVGFATTEAYDAFAELDCPEMRTLIDELRADPYPDGEYCYPTPGGGDFEYVRFRIVDGFVYKVAYRVIFGPVAKVAILAPSVQRFPDLGLQW
jgi:hypothetical protein